MLGGTVGAGSPGGEDLLTVTVVRDEHGYGMKVSGDNPVYVQSVKEHGAAWRAGLRAGDRILRVDSVPVHHHTHQQVVHMIRANPTTVLTVQQNSSRTQKTPITAPLPVNPEKQRQLEVSKAHTVRLMLEQEQKYIRDLRNELLKVPDVRKQAQLESAEQRCSILQHEIDIISTSQPEAVTTPTTPTTPKLSRKDPDKMTNTGFLSGLPRSLSNLTGQSLRNLRQARQKQETPLVRQNSDETNNKRRHVHNNTVPMVPTTCLDNTPPPLPPRSTERPKRNIVNPLANVQPCTSMHQKQFYKKPYPMHQSMPAFSDDRFRRSSHSLDGELEGPQPNSIALQMSYPLVNVPPPPLQTDNRGGVPVLHVRSQSSPEHLDHELPRTSASGIAIEKEPWSRGTPPPGTPPPPYPHPPLQTQPCADPQRAIISMEEDDSPSSDNSTYSGLFSNLRCVRESKARTAVLINWLLGERRCASASLVLVLTDAYRSAVGVSTLTLRRWAYEIQSTFLMPNAVLQLNGIDENMANEIEHVLVNEYDKEELLRNVFRKARRQAKDELVRQLSEFQVKRQVGLGTLYGPEDAVLQRCVVDKTQEQIVVERLMCSCISSVARSGAGPGGCVSSPDAHAALLAALCAAALCLHCRPASVAAAVGGSRGSFLQRDKLYKQRRKQLAKQNPQPFVVRGHHLQLQELTSVAHCHYCDNVIWGLAPQAYICTDCKLHVHRTCARSVEEGCCLDGEHHNNRISRFMERIHQPPGLDSSDKKSRKASGTAHFLNMERSFRKVEDDPPWDVTLSPAALQERRDESDESLYESADCHSDAISASDDALPRLIKTPTMSKESLKIAITDEESEAKSKKGHRKTMSLSNPLEIVKSLGDEWFDNTKKDSEKNSDKKKSRESLWSEEDRDSIHGSTMKLDQIRKNSKKEDKQSESRKSSTTDAPKRKSSKGSSVSALNFLRRKKTPTSMKAVEAVVEVVDGIVNTDEILNYTKFFLEEEKRHTSLCQSKPPVETDSDEDMPAPKVIGEHRRRLSRQTSRSKSKVRGKSQSLKVNTLRKSHSGTLKKGKKKSVKTPLAGRSRQASIVEPSPLVKKKNSDISKQNSWLFSGSKGESRREGSTEEPSAPDVDVDASDNTHKEPEKEQNWKGGTRGVNRAESCREREPSRRGKYRNASDPNRLTAHPNHDLEPGAATAPSGSSSSSSLSSRSNESNTVAADQQASQSDWSEEEDPLAAQWSDSLPPHIRDSIILSARIRKRQEVIHELIVSEGSHVRWLKVLGVDFLKPLERQTTLISQDELKALFPNLPGVRERHTKLYADLRKVRNDAPNHVVQIRPVADAMLNTLGESGYAPCLSKFCRGQRMALDSLRERRRKNKELHQFLAGREQLPRCGRLQLRDLLACVWQRLTKYQLLLESILKTASEDESEEGDSVEDINQLRKALNVAKDVLHSVDTAIRTAENEHRLRTIQNKLEFRFPSGSEYDELRRLDLTTHSLRLEGELALRTDTKKIHVLALMLEDSLVLLQREGDKFILRPLAQPGHNAFLSPLIKWDKVLFRPNAAVRNTFFLMNINSIQMHELSANTTAEYTTWVKHIQESPLARIAESKPSLTPSHQHARSTDDTNTTVNVSRNPSDASEKSTSSAPPDCEVDRERSAEREESEKRSIEREEKEREEREEREREEREEREERSSEKEEDVIKQRRVGRISTHGGDPRPELEPNTAVTIRPPPIGDVHTATRVLSHHERLRRLDEAISRALRAKSAVVAELLGVPPQSFNHLAEIAIADTLGQVDICGELNAPRDNETAPDLHQLLLAAQAQANQLTEALSGALSVSEAGTIAARSGRCDSCRDRHRHNADSSEQLDKSGVDADTSRVKERSEGAVEADASYDMLADLSANESALEPALDEQSDPSAAQLASRLVGSACGIQAALGAMLAALPAVERERRLLRSELARARDRVDALRRRDYQMTEDIFPKGVDQSIQDQPSNGG